MPKCLEPVRRPAQDLEWPRMHSLTPYEHTVSLPECGLPRMTAGSGYVKVDTPRAVAPFLASGAISEPQWGPQQGHIHKVENTHTSRECVHKWRKCADPWTNLAFRRCKDGTFWHVCDLPSLWTNQQRCSQDWTVTLRTRLVCPTLNRNWPMRAWLPPCCVWCMLTPDTLDLFQIHREVCWESAIGQRWVEHKQVGQLTCPCCALAAP